VRAAPPGSVLGDIVQAVRGRITMRMLDVSPNFAVATAEEMAQQSAQAMAAQQQASGQQTSAQQAGGEPRPAAPGAGAGSVAPPADGGGNFAAALGVREPGLGMGIDLPGGPVPPGVVTP